jgi:hypothetical protein
MGSKGVFLDLDQLKNFLFHPELFDWHFAVYLSTIK